MRHFDRARIRERLLDEATADRLLAGRLPADDAPPGFREVAELVHALGTIPAEDDLSRGGEVVFAMTSHLSEVGPVPAPARARLRRGRVAQLAAAGTISAMGLFSGLAVANALPGAAQGVASDVLGTLGVHVPSPNSHAGSHIDTRGQSTSQPSSNGKGGDISSLATGDSTSGVDRGASVSGTASDGHSQAGTHGSPTASTATSSPGAPFSPPPVTTPPVTGVPTSFPPVTTPPVTTPPVTRR